ncbi:MAG: gluconate 2-dehydrogenase subunit 3 family protein [Marinoscillum sp.]
MERRDAMKKMGLAMGYTLSASTLASLMTSCAEPATLDWEPKYFSSEQALNVEALSEAILPKTDTPGAVELGVPQFLDSFVGEVMTQQDRESYFKELDQFFQLCKTSQGEQLYQCDEQQKKAFLDEQNAQNKIKYPGIWGADMVKADTRNFFGKFKDTLVWVFFTTEVGGEQLLAYDPVPGSYTGCTTISENTRSWSLS